MVVGNGISEPSISIDKILEISDRSEWNFSKTSKPYFPRSFSNSNGEDWKFWNRLGWPASCIHHMGSFFVWWCSERHCFYKMLSRFNSNSEIYIVHFAKHESLWKNLQKGLEGKWQPKPIAHRCMVYFTYLFSIQSNQSWIGKYAISSHGWGPGCLNDWDVFETKNVPCTHQPTNQPETHPPTNQPTKPTRNPPTNQPTRNPPTMAAVAYNSPGIWWPSPTNFSRLQKFYSTKVMGYALAMRRGEGHLAMSPGWFCWGGWLGLGHDETTVDGRNPK